MATATRLQFLARRLGHSSLSGFTSRHIYSSVLLSPVTLNKGLLPSQTVVASKSVETLLQEVEDRVRAQIEESKEYRRQRTELEAPTLANRAAGLGLPGLRTKLLSEDPSVQFSAAQQCRRLLSVEGETPVEEVVVAGLVSPLVQLLSPAVGSSLKLEAAWALTNIASGTGEAARAIAAEGGVPAFIQLLSSSDNALREQAAWAVGNLAGDCVELRDLIISSGGLRLVSDILKETTDGTSSLRRTATWVFSNLCRGEPGPSLEFVRPALPTLAGLLRDDNDEIVEHACWAFAYLTGSSTKPIAPILECGMCKQLAALLMHPSTKVQIPALRTLGNIAAGTDQHTQAVVQCNVLPALTQLATRTDALLNKGACWLISNIVVGCPEQIPLVIDSGITKPIVELVKSSGDPEIRKEASWALGNMILNGEQSHISQLVQYGCVEPIAELLHIFDKETSVRLLAVLERILHIGSDLQKEEALLANPFAIIVQQASGPGKIEAFKTDAHADARRLARNILAYF